MTAIFVIIVGLMFVNFLMPEISNFREDMNCASADTISDGTKLLCLVTDATIPYWIMLVLSTTIGLITARLLL